MNPPPAHRSPWGATLAALTLLGACSPGPGGGAPVAASAAASAVRDDALARELERVERAAVARPAESELALRARGQGVPAGSATALDLLALRAWLAALARDHALSDELIKQLRDWPPGGLKGAATLAAAVAGSEYQRAQGDLRGALKTLLDVDQGQVAAAPLLFRWRYHNHLSFIGSDAGELETSLAHGHVAQRLAETSGQPWRAALSLVNQAFTASRAELPERARQLIDQALVQAQKSPDSMTLNRVLTIRGIIHGDDPDPGIALQSHTQALEHATAAGADGRRALGLGNLADHYLRLGQWARALALAEQALPLAQAARDINAEVVARSNIGLAKILMGRVAEGREDARLSNLLDEQQGSLPYAAAGWEELAGYLEKAGDLHGAVDAYREHRRINDRLLRDETRRLLIETQERQDAEQHARDIELLNRDNALKAEQLQQRNLALALWATLGGGALVLLGLLWQAFRRVRRANEALADSNASLKHQSETDPLTGLANRRHFHAALKHLTGSQGLTASVYLIDIDHFKRINDRHGHAAGDAVLVDVAQRLNQAVRDDDLLVRWGGEEFLILARGQDGREGQLGAQLGQRVLDLIGGRPVRQDGLDIRVTVSIGFISLPLPAPARQLPWERVIDLVDAALYLAKAHGRNRAYGIEHLQAEDALAAAQLAARLEAASREGLVGLQSLTGPERSPSAEAGP